MIKRKTKAEENGKQIKVKKKSWEKKDGQTNNCTNEQMNKQQLTYPL